MRRIKDEYRALDYIFAHEPLVTDIRYLTLIATSYETARQINSLAAELARRRYREREQRLKTCRQLYISEAQYYKLLGAFLRIARHVETALD